MKTLSYSPHIEAYIAASGNGTVSYYDISEDIVNGSVTRNQDAPSSFSLVLANKHRKYDDILNPLDRISISLYKEHGKKVPVLVGYVTEVPKFNVYGAQVKISGYCSLYRLQRLYWDAGLLASRRDVLGWQQDMDWTEIVRRLLTKVGGYPDDAVSIGEMPKSVVEWAKALYAAKVTDIQQAKDLADQFYRMLAVSGPQLETGVGAGAAGGFDDSGLGAGGIGDVKLPAGLGTYATREFDLRSDRVATGMTSPYGFGLSTTQRRVQDAWIAAGAKHDSQGFCKLNGKYLVATTSVFGEIGTHTTFYFSNNKSIETIKIDAKAETVCAWDPNPANKWGHTNGQCVLEFCGTEAIGNNPYMVLGLSGVTVTSATVHGRVC